MTRDSPTAQEVSDHTFAPAKMEPSSNANNNNNDNGESSSSSGHHGHKIGDRSGKFATKAKSPLSGRDMPPVPSGLGQNQLPQIPTVVVESSAKHHGVGVDDEGGLGLLAKGRKSPELSASAPDLHSLGSVQMRKVWDNIMSDASTQEKLGTVAIFSVSTLPSPLRRRLYLATIRELEGRGHAEALPGTQRARDRARR